MHVHRPTVDDLPTPGDTKLRRAGLALGVAFDGELDAFRPHAPEARLAAAMTGPRRRDFLVGRLAARRALDALAIPAAPVLAAGKRPLFPRPATGSISHSCGVGVALAGRRDVVGSVGVDVEFGRISLRTARGACTPDELAWALSARSEAARAARATALFSAKESAYKALPARAQSSLWLRDIAIAPRGSGFTARVQVAGLEIEGEWRLGSGILTWATCGLERPGRPI
jgi:enterobactin synthetase component D